MNPVRVCAFYLLVNVASVIFLLASYHIGANIHELTGFGESREVGGAIFLIISGMLASMWAPIRISRELGNALQKE